jgi:5-formaminoimidazole-4-carboxamide-1-beta-D-ribofuranosyl 5'-monophosphate synthetase
MSPCSYFCEIVGVGKNLLECLKMPLTCNIIGIFCEALLVSNNLLLYFQEIAAILISFERHNEWQSKEVKIR